jgi:hypothetical protein
MDPSLIISAFPVLTKVAYQILALHGSKLATKKRQEIAKKLLINEIEFNLSILKQFLPETKTNLSIIQAKALAKTLEHSILELVYADSELSDILNTLCVKAHSNEEENHLGNAKAKIKLKTSHEAASFLLRKTAEIKALASFDIELPRKIDWNIRFDNLKISYINLIKKLK